MLVENALPKEIDDLCGQLNALEWPVKLKCVGWFLLFTLFDHFVKERKSDKYLPEKYLEFPFLKINKLLYNVTTKYLTFSTNRRLISII